MYDIYAILDDLKSSRIKKVVLDSDTYNEEDDQFAVAYAMLSPDSIELIALQAAPFHNGNSSGPEDGMLKSYAELRKIAAMTNPDYTVPIYEGSRRFLGGRETPVNSPATENLIALAKQTEERIYVVCIGAITNIASAILLYPAIKDKIVVVFLGSHAEYTHERNEFNMAQDIAAAQTVFDSGVPMVLLPALGGTVDLRVSQPELDAHLSKKNELCDYLVNLVRKRCCLGIGGTKVIWDIGGVAAVSLPGSMTLTVSPTPIVTRESYCVYRQDRHPMILASRLNRDIIFRDMFIRLAEKPR